MKENEFYTVKEIMKQTGYKRTISRHCYIQWKNTKKILGWTIQNRIKGGKLI